MLKHLCFLVACAATMAQAQTQPTDPNDIVAGMQARAAQDADQGMLLTLIEAEISGGTPAARLASMISGSGLQQFLEDGRLTRQELLDYDRALIAAARARRIARILAADLNGDGQVTREENARYDRMFNFSEYDRDGDGTILFEEMLASAQEALNGRSQLPAAGLMVFDLNADGAITQEEIDAGIRALIALHGTSEAP